MSFFRGVHSLSTNAFAQDLTPLLPQYEGPLAKVSQRFHLEEDYNP